MAIVLTLATTVLGEVLGGVLPLWLRSLHWLMTPLPSWWTGLLAAQPLARSYQLSLLLAGIIAAPSFIPLFLMSDDRPQRRPESELGSSAQSTFSLRPVQQSLVRWRKQPLQVFLFSPLVTLILVQILIGTGAGLFLPYFNLYFVQHLKASPALFGVIDGAANTLNALLTLLAPWMVARFGKITTLILPRLLSIPLMLGIGLAGSLPLAATLYPFRQGLMDMSQGILQLFSMEAVAPQQRGFANSSYQAAYQVSMALSASLAGLIIARIGYAPVFIGAALLYSLALLLLWSRFSHVPSLI
jgi:Na+/melibiose symporter-like transporter